jgi:hypothetical protein
MNEVTLNSLIKKRKLWKKFKYCKSPLNKSNYDEVNDLQTFAHRYIIFICTWYFIGKSVPKFINISLGQF